MKQVQEALANLIYYEAISEINPLTPPTIEKHDIPKFIICKNFEKAENKIERSMERYNNKVNQFKGKLEQLEIDIEAMKKEQKKWSKKASAYCDRTNVRDVEKQNLAAEMTNSLIEKIGDAHEKHADIVDKHNEALDEAKEKLEELTQEALLVIDDDIVAVLDKCLQTAIKFSGSDNSEELTSALEICFFTLKIFNLFEGHIDRNNARKEAKDRFSETNELCSKLCTNGNVRNYLNDLFRRNISLREKNTELYRQVVKLIESVELDRLDSLIDSFGQVFQEDFNTSFKYEGIIDPNELEAVMVDIQRTIDALKANITKTKELKVSSHATSEAAAKTNNNIESMLETMKTNVEEMREDLLYKGHFASTMMNEAIIGDFYHPDLRPVMAALREHLASLIGDEQIETLTMEDEDRFLIKKTESTIKQANLLKLQAQRDQVEEHTMNLNSMIKNVEGDLDKAGQIPQKNSDAFTSRTTILYILSCFPVFGFVFALGIIGKIKGFASGFRSNNGIYQKLGSQTLSKNKTFQIVNLVIGILLGFVGIGALYGLKVGPEAIGLNINLEALGLTINPEIMINIYLPCAVLIFCLITEIILIIAGKVLRKYIAEPKAA